MGAVFPPPQVTFRSLAVDPYAAYRALRESDPVCRTSSGAWVLLRYADVDALWRDPRLSVERRDRPQSGLADRRGAAAMLNRDAPDHPRLRGAVTPLLTDHARGLPDAIRALSRELLGDLEGDVDLVTRYASPLAFRTLTRLLGVPPELEEPLRRSCATLVESVDLWWTALLGGDIAPDIATFRTAGTRAREILAPLAADGGRGLLPELARCGDVDAAEAVEQALLMLMAGHEPACNLVSNTVLALAERPGQLQTLRDDRSLVPDAVTESLRYDSPIQLSRRYAVEEVEAAGGVIPAEATIILAVGSANRDPRAWGPDADDFDVRRPDAGRHVAFGRGAHHCLGAGVARVVARVAVEDLLAEFADVRLAGDPVRNGRVNVRGLRELPLTVKRG